MTDDIVNRLNCEAQNCILYNHGDAQLAIEAADEIERLRKVAYSMAQTLEINGKWLDVNENGEYVPMKADAIFLDFYEDETAWANEK
jgi:hypothetical protein